jgi:hypothetical protein
LRFRRRRLLLLLIAWDLAWRVIAVRRALKNRQHRWVLPLAIVNSGGIFPMLYLSRWARPRRNGAEVTSSASRGVISTSRAASPPLGR